MNQVKQSARIHGLLPSVTLVPLSIRPEDQGLADTRINATAFKRPAITSRGGYQFASYYGRDKKLLVARRSFEDPLRWSIFRTPFESRKATDPHTVSVIAVDGDGVLHLSWGMHKSILRYTHSKKPATNDESIEFLDETAASAVPLRRAPITYPEFTAVPASGDLLFMFRTGRAGNGNYHLFRWFVSERRWKALVDTANAALPWISGKPHTPNIAISPYPTNLAFDRLNRIHVAWTWRSGNHAPDVFKGYQSNHNVLYACSGPLTDVPTAPTWHRANGEAYERIDESTAKPVLLLPQGSSLINTWSLTTDDRDEPLIATWFAPRAAQGDHTRQYMLLRKQSEAWIAQQIGTRRAEGSGRLPESSLNEFSMARPVILYEDGYIIVILRDHQNGGRVTAAVKHGGDSHWDFIDLTNENAGLWEPSYDVERFRKDGILSMLYQPSGLGMHSHDVYVLEWNVRDFLRVFRSRA